MFCHDCEFRFDYPGMDPAHALHATAGDLIDFIERGLPQATVLVHDGDADNDWTRLDALHRVMLPRTKEHWHTKSATRGTRHLPFDPVGGAPPTSPTFVPTVASAMRH